MAKRKTNRLKEYDYSNAGCYFVTICTKDRINYFGEITNGEMILNQYGKIAYKNWADIKNHFDHVELAVFVVMPNHIHGLINIIEPFTAGEARPRNGQAYMRPKTNGQENRIKMTLSKIIQQYKASVTRDINANYKNNFE